MANYTHSTLTAGQIAALQSSSPTISIGSINSSNPFSALGSVNSVSLSLDDFNNPHVKKYQVMEIEEDLLALSATWYRLRQATVKGQPYIPITKIIDKDLFKHVTEKDREVASNIRDYYSKKIMMWKLKGQNLTKFREDMNSLIHSEGKVFKEDMCPLAYRLPEFYFYDTSFDELANEHNKIVKERKHVPETKTLNLHKTFTVGKKYSKRKEYWFTDSNDNLVTLSLTHDNPLLSLLDLASKNPLAITAKFNVKDRDNVQYMYCDKYTFS